MSQTKPPESKFKSRIISELRTFAIVSLYLFICFSIFLIYDTSHSAARDIAVLSLGVVLGKSLVMGKFILIGEALKSGSRMKSPTLLHRLVWRTLGLLLVLVVLKLLEEVLIGLVHGQGLREIFAQLSRQPWQGLVSSVLLMVLVLIPLITAIELARVLGAAEFKRLLFGEQK